MRLVILNPHVNYCGKMVFNWLFGFPHHHKYTYLWRETLKHKDRKIGFLVDGTQSSFYQTSYFQKTISCVPILLKIFSFFEFWLWMLINRINPSRCDVFFHVSRLDPKNDIIFSFGFTSFKSQLNEYEGLVLVHLTHYHHNTKEIAEYYNRFRHGFLVAENDLTHHEYFRQYFNSTRMYQLPLAISSERFKIKTEFGKRINKCFASGSMSVPSSDSYVAYYGKGMSLNPMREHIYRKKKQLEEIIDAYIYPHNETIRELKTIKETDVPFTRFAKKFLPSWFLTGFLHYKLPFFGFDIVEKYNQYTMFMSPEERTGLPSMKMLEGIVCGAVLIGVDDTMYTNIGFKDRVNYIAYRENDMNDLVEKISYYQNHPVELEEISMRGREFAMTHFTPEKVMEIFWKDLKQLLQFFNRGRAEFKSSFVV